MVRDEHTNLPLPVCEARAEHEICKLVHLEFVLLKPNDVKQQQPA